MTTYPYELSPDERIAILSKRIGNLRKIRGDRGIQTSILHAESALAEATRDKRAWAATS